MPDLTVVRHLVEKGSGNWKREGGRNVDPN